LNYTRRYRDQYTPNQLAGPSEYIASTSPAKRSSTLGRFTFRVGVISPSSMVQGSRRR